MSLYEQLKRAVPAGSLVSYSVLYDATALAAPTVQEVCVAPFDAKVIHAALIINTAVVGGDTGVALKVDGGTAFDTLQTGAGTKGLVDNYDPADLSAAPDVDDGSQITATSDGTATAGDVIVQVTLQKRE